MEFMKVGRERQRRREREHRERGADGNGVKVNSKLANNYIIETIRSPHAAFETWACTSDAR